MIQESLTVIFAVYILLLISCVFVKKMRVLSYLSVTASAISVVCAVLTAVGMYDCNFIFENGPLYMDRISLIFFCLVSFVSLMTMLYSDGYIFYEKEEGIVSDRDLRQYYITLNLFVAVMYVTFIVNSLALIWLCVGATTLVSTFLVGFYKNGNSTEAAWKYMTLCSVGITVALLGITLLYASTLNVITDPDTALDWTVLMKNAGMLDSDLMRISIVLIIIGYGTKVGFAPMHTWLPDAHSQAPTPVSGMLSAVLLNCALYAVLRCVMISEITIPDFADTILLIFGLFSLFIAAMFIIGSKDLKRMLAYSSIENMGLIAIGFGIGTELSIFGALIQLIAHSVTKPLLFFAAGNIIQKYETRDMNLIRGVREKMPFTAFMMAAGSLIIVGVPPFSVFVGEFCIVYGAVSSNAVWVAVLTLFLLVFVFAGFTKHIFEMLSGHTEQDVGEHKGILRKIPFVAMFVMTLIIGLFMPESFSEFLHGAASAVGGLI
jgi:hydrogenase-4 component F